MMKFATVTLGAALLAACTTGGQRTYETGPREPISLRDDDDMCGQSLVQTFIGLRANAALRAEITERSGAGTIRWIEPNTAVTMDFRADRLNGEIDEDGAIRTLRCG